MDLLVFKGKQDLEELMMKWKTPMHLRQYLDEEKHKTRPMDETRNLPSSNKPMSPFLKKFLGKA